MGNDKKTATEAKPKAEKKPKNKVTLRFVGAQGKDELAVIRKTIAPGSIQTFAVLTTYSPDKLTSKGKPKKIRKRFDAQMHKDEASAKSAVDKIVAQATKMNWIPKKKSVKQPDSFDLSSLPAPTVVKK